MGYFVYILKSDITSKYYIGQNFDLLRRLEEHNFSEGTSYTSKFRPWRVLISMNVKTRSQALKMEKYLKKKPRDFLVQVSNDEKLRSYVICKFMQE